MEMLALAAARREAALRSELQALKLGQLCTRATNDGVDALSLEQAQDSDTPKEAVIALCSRQPWSSRRRLHVSRRNPTSSRRPIMRAHLRLLPRIRPNPAVQEIQCLSLCRWTGTPQLGAALQSAAAKREGQRS